MKDIKAIMSAEPEKLFQQQHDALKQHIIDVLQKTINFIEAEQYREILERLSDSPAGDGWGQDNRFIEFAYMDGGSLDIGEVLDFLESLRVKSQ